MERPGFLCRRDSPFLLSYLFVFTTCSSTLSTKLTWHWSNFLPLNRRNEDHWRQSWHFLGMIFFLSSSLYFWASFSSVQFSSVTQLCPTLCNHMNCSMSGLPVYHQLPEFTQSHVHWVGDAIQPSHPLLSPSPSAFNPSQHQGLFKWVSSSHQVAKVLEFQLQHQSFQWTPRSNDVQWTSPLGQTGWISLQSKGLSRVFSNTTVQKHQFSVLSFLYSPTLTSIHDYWKNHSLD